MSRIAGLITAGVHDGGGLRLVIRESAQITIRSTTTGNPNVE
jgi:hypothetical protein